MSGRNCFSTESITNSVPMDPFTSFRSTTVAVGIGVLLVVGAVGGGAHAGDGNGAAPEATAVVEDSSTGVRDESADNNATIPPNQTIEAIRAVGNRTNGTVFGAQLTGGGDDELTRSTFVYEVDVVATNGTHLVAKVYANNRTVFGLETANESDGFLDDLFGSDDGVAEQARNASSLRSAADAVALAVNQTEPERANLTVTGVDLTTKDGRPVYVVTVLGPGAEPREIQVPANRGSDGGNTTTPGNRGN